MQRSCAITIVGILHQCSSSPPHGESTLRLFHHNPSLRPFQEEEYRRLLGSVSGWSGWGIEGSRPLGATRARLGNCVLNSELSLPPVSMLCEEFDCVPAGAAACPAHEKALSLMSSAIPDVRPRYQARRLRWRPAAKDLWAGNSWRLPVLSRQFVVSDISRFQRFRKWAAAHDIAFHFAPAVVDLEPKVSAPHWLCDRPLAGVQSWSLYISVIRQLVSSSTHSQMCIHVCMYVCMHACMHVCTLPSCRPIAHDISMIHFIYLWSGWHWFQDWLCQTNRKVQVLRCLASQTTP